MENLGKGLYEIDDRTYIFHSENAKEIVLNQAIAGNRLKKLAREAAKDFITTAHDIALKGVKPKNLCEAVLLSGGNYYGLAQAFEDVHDVSLNQCYIGVKRYQNNTGEWDARSTYDSFDSLTDNATILIGDTVATGSTLRKSIRVLADELKVRKFNLDKIVVYSLVGAKVGGDMLKDLEKELRRDWPESRVFYFVSEALFGLDENGTDMPFYHKDTIKCPEIRQALETTPLVAKKMKCAIFDWGDRCKYPINHSAEFIQYCDELLVDEEDLGIRKEINYMRQTALEQLEESERIL